MENKNQKENLMDKKFAEMSDEEWDFGIVHLRVDEADENGLYGAGGEIHREGMTKKQALYWLSSFAEERGTPGDATPFAIVASPRRRWTLAEGVELMDAQAVLEIEEQDTILS